MVRPRAPAAGPDLAGRDAGSWARAAPHWLRLVLVVVAVASVSAFGVSTLRQTLYGARAEIVYELGDTAPPDVDRLMATQLALLGSRAVLAPAAEEHGLEPETLAARVEPEVVDDSQVMALTVSDPDPEVARSLAATIVSRYREAATAGPAGATTAPGPRLLSEPYVLEDPVAPRPLQAVAVGALAGLVLAGATVVWLYRPRAEPS